MLFDIEVSDLFVLVARAKAVTPAQVDFAKRL